MTVGQPEINFQKENHFLVDDFLQSVKQSAEYTQMNYLGYTALYGISPVSGIAKNAIAAKAEQHSGSLYSLIQKFC